MTPPTPVDELLRLETLRRLKILDTDPEERFDRVTRLAKQIFGTPIALVSLVDADRQWFKSRQGLDAKETPRDISFCGHAILEDKVMVVEDTHSDERFADNPLVESDPGIRFYAGYPLNAPDGSKVGTLCVIDREPRQMTTEERALLAELGAMVEEEFVVAAMMREDPITGISNRSGFCTVAEHLLAMCNRTDMPASLMIFHLTNVAEIEASRGTVEADRALIELTHLLLASFRDSDTVGRIADDKFAVLLAGSRMGDLDEIRKRLMESIGERNGATLSYWLEVEAHGIAYRQDLHPDIDSLIDSIEQQIDEMSEAVLQMTGQHSA